MTALTTKQLCKLKVQAYRKRSRANDFTVRESTDEVLLVRVKQARAQLGKAPRYQMPDATRYILQGYEWAVRKELYG